MTENIEASKKPKFVVANLAETAEALGIFAKYPSFYEGIEADYGYLTVFVQPQDLSEEDLKRIYELRWKPSENYFYLAMVQENKS